MAQKDEFVFKIALLGGAGCGKTSLIDKFVERKFTQDYNQHSGHRLLRKILRSIKPEVDWCYGTSPVKKNMKMSEVMYLGGAQGAILVYDMTRRPTFEEIKSKWVKDFQKYALKERPIYSHWK